MNKELKVCYDIELLFKKQGPLREDKDKEKLKEMILGLSTDQFVFGGHNGYWGDGSIMLVSYTGLGGWALGVGIAFRTDPAEVRFFRENGFCQPEHAIYLGKEAEKLISCFKKHCLISFGYKKEVANV